MMIRKRSPSIRYARRIPLSYDDAFELQLASSLEDTATLSLTKAWMKIDRSSEVILCSLLWLVSVQSFPRNKQ